jgi:biopolymer transport protein ExbB
VIYVTKFCATAAAVALLSVTAAYAAEGTAVNLDQLLQQTKNAKAEEAKLNAEREARFKADASQQAKLLADAMAARNAAEARSNALSAQFDANDLEIAAQRDLLKTREGNLGELFGVTRQVAGDAANTLSQSLISAQFPDREDFLRNLASAKVLPSINELEQLWFVLQQEMTESGRIAKLNAEIVGTDGVAGTGEVIRIGPFVATSGSDYLTYLPSKKALGRLTRQPPAKFGAIAEELSTATSGYVPAVADPSRGVLLAMYVERPNVWERIEKGELVGYVILVVGFIGALCAIYQTLYLIAVRIKVRRQVKSLDRPVKDNPLGRVLLAFKGDGKNIEDDAEIAELRLSEAVLRELPNLERFQAFLRLAVAAGPLLGLIGTVVGMIVTFQSITESGSSDPKLMANGISQAMICTVLGLGIAIPLLFANAGLVSMSQGLSQMLDEQSTGLLAEAIEKRRA